MVFWVFALTLTIVVAAMLIGAARSVSRGHKNLSAADADLSVYRDQLTEVERDLARGVLSESEAVAVRVEVSRRLLEADKRAGEDAVARDAGPNTALIAIVSVCIIGGGLGFYSWLGAPGYGDLPIKERIAAADAALQNRPNQAQAEVEAAPMLPIPPPPSPEVLELIDRLRATMAERPDDAQGQMLLARNEARLGNLAAARQAQTRLVELKGSEVTLSERTGLLDLMVLAAGGYVSPEAETLALEILADRPDAEVPLYYIGLMNAQGGRADLAFPVWRKLLETSPPDAAWVAVIREQIEDLAAAAGVPYQLPDLRGPSQADIAAAEDMSTEDRDAMIRGMVSGLADRLATQGGPVEDWARLISALGVLGEAAQAIEIATEARSVFAGNESALAQIEAATAGVAR